MIELQPLSHYFSEEHESFRASLRSFIKNEITPYVHEWDEAEEIPRELFRKLGALGVTGIGFDEEYGGTPADTFGGASGEKNARRFEVYGYPFLGRKPG